MPEESSALIQLVELRRRQQKVEQEELAAARATLKVLDQTVIKGGRPAFKLQRKHYFILGAAASVLIALLVTYQIILGLLAPGAALEKYQDAVASGDDEAAFQSLQEYLDLEPDDWERNTELAKRLLFRGESLKARNLFARITDNSSFGNDAELRFYFALSFLPAKTETEKTNSSLLASLEDFIPALVFDSVIKSDSDPEQALASINKAATLLAGLEKGSERFQQYRDLTVALTRIICINAPELFAHRISPRLESYPKELYPHQLTIYSIDPAIRIEFCSFFPDTAEALEKTPSLGALVHFYRAYINTANGDYETALSAIGASTINDTMTAATYLEGALLAQNGEFDAAHEKLKEVDVDNNPVLLHTLSTAQMLSGPSHWDAAFRNLEKSIRIEPNTPEMLNNRAVLAIINNRLGLANTDLELALEIFPNYSYALFNLAVVKLEEGDYKGATSRFDDLAEHTGQFPGLNYLHASALEGAGVFDKALSSYRLALVDPGYKVLAHLAIADFHSQTPVGYEAALKFYAEAFDLAQNNYHALFGLAGVMSSLGESQKALDLINDNLSLFDDLTDGQRAEFEDLLALTRGQLLYDSDQLNKAISTLMKVFNESQNTEARQRTALLLTDILLESEQIEEALEITRSILPSDPENQQLLEARARALAANNDISEALAVIDPLGSSDDASEVVLLTYARILALDEHWSKSVAIYERVFDQNPADVTPLEEALEILNEHLSTSPKTEELANLLNLSSGDGGASVDKQLLLPRISKIVNQEQIAQVTEQIAQLTELIDSDSVERLSGLVNRATLLSQVGRYNESIADLEAVLDLGPPVDLAHQLLLSLGQINVSAGNIERADAVFTRAFELGTEDSLRALFARAVNRERYNQQGALADYNLLTEMAPASFLLYLRRGALKLNISDIEGAVRDLTHAIRINPENVEPYKLRLSAYNILGDRANVVRDSETINLLSARNN